MGKLQIVHKWEMSSGALHSFPIQDGQGLCIYVGTPASNWPTKIILTRDGQDTEKSTPWTKSNRFQSFCRSRQALVEANYSYLKLRPGNKQSQKKKKKAQFGSPSPNPMGVYQASGMEKCTIILWTWTSSRVSLHNWAFVIHLYYKCPEHPMQYIIMQLTAL